ncbi:hypothetical protein ABN702_05005 [Bacillus haimaensis]|uniref:hypothetical protein n=1 Tax=Bacillus haimaensis TaxID=3160967 RepID=UPI003AA833E0
MKRGFGKPILIMLLSLAGFYLAIQLFQNPGGLFKSLLLIVGGQLSSISSSVISFKAESVVVRRMQDTARQLSNPKRNTQRRNRKPM